VSSLSANNRCCGPWTCLHRRCSPTSPPPPTSPTKPVVTRPCGVARPNFLVNTCFRSLVCPSSAELRYDIAANEGFVVVGDDHDTAAFAVATIGRWWDMVGRVTYPAARQLLITADAGGSNGHRVRLWKVELGRLAARAGIDITVCHFPPGTSKWNKIEHRLRSAVTSNWRGRPLTSHEVVVNLIGATTNKKGLKVQAHRDTCYYPTGVKITKTELAAVPLTRHDFHGDWNYTMHPGPRAAGGNYGQVTTTMLLCGGLLALIPVPILPDPGARYSPVMVCTHDFGRSGGSTFPTGRRA